VVPIQPGTVAYGPVFHAIWLDSPGTAVGVYPFAPTALRGVNRPVLGPVWTAVQDL